MEEKTAAEQLTEELFYAPEHACKQIDDADIQAADAFCVGYMDFCGPQRRSAKRSAL